ncbi:MAG: flagellin, partial [Armatimonadota bacterium]
QALNKISEETMFMSRKLLNGEAGIKATIFDPRIKAMDLRKIIKPNNFEVHVNVTQAATKATLNSATTAGGLAGAFHNATAGTMVINGVRVNWPANSTNEDVINAINAVSDETNVVATYDTDHIVLTQTKYGSDQKIELEGSAQFAIGGAIKATAIGVDARAVITDGTNIISDSTWASGKGLVLRDTLGNVIVLDESANAVANLGEIASAKVGTLTFQVGAYANQLRKVNLSSVHSSQLGIFAIPGKSIADIDLTTFRGAQEAITIIDDAISQMSSLRAELGSLQKQVLESSIRSLGIAKENIQASESTIRDTNMAEEVVEMTRNQILQQAGVSMLTQANQTPMALMALLRQ